MVRRRLRRRPLAPRRADGPGKAVAFDTAYQDGDPVYSGTFHVPAYSQAQSDPHDLAVVVLDRAVKGITPALLPKAGSLSALSQG